MNVPLLTAVTDAVWEADLVAAFERTDFGISVVRRCVDLADLLAAASSGTARGVLLSADLRRLDRDALARLSAAGLAVVGLAKPGDERAEGLLRQLGVAYVLPADAGPERISAVVSEAVLTATVGGPDPMLVGYAEPRAALPDPRLSGNDGGLDGDAEIAEAEAGVRRGTLVAVWGPTGAPGRTSVAVTIATEAICLDIETLLVDADTYGGAVAQVLGMLDESPGLAAAVRLANNGALDLPALARLASAVRVPGAARRLRVLTGITRADRWPELRASGVSAVYDVARRLAALTVVDCGFCLEEDEELSFDTAAPRRNAATLASLAAADTIVAVGSADPVGVQRLVRGLSDLREALPDADVRVVANRVRKGPINGDAGAQLLEAMRRYAGIDDVTLVPDDRAAFDKALAGGRCLAEVAPGSAARAALAGLAARLAGDPSPTQARRLRAVRPFRSKQARSKQARSKQGRSKQGRRVRR